jgi:hypothetical protein
VGRAFRASAVRAAAPQAIVLCEFDIESWSTFTTTSLRKAQPARRSGIHRRVVSK